MFEQQLFFLRILCQSIRKECDFKFNISPQEKDWAELSRMSSVQHVLPMVYDVICKTEEFSNALDATRMLWRRNATSFVISQTRKTKEFLKLYEKLVCNGIEVLVIKGIVCRTLYNNPDFRISGDEDIVIKKEHFKKCDSFLIENGFTRNEIDINNPEFETSYFDKNKGLRIEVHTSLMPEKILAFSKFNSEFDGIFDKKEEIIVDGVKIYTLDYTMHLFYLLCHSYKHFIISGFGIRQLCDIMLMAEHYGYKINWKYIIDTSKKYGMYRFFANLFYIAENHLGFNWQKSGCPRIYDVNDDSENLLNDMLDAGAYGKSSLGREHSTNVTLSAVENMNGKAKISLKSSIFPTKAYMIQNYSYVKKHIWLIPVAWAHRIFKYTKKVYSLRKNGRKDINSIETGKKRVQLLKQYGIIKQ